MELRLRVMSLFADSSQVGVEMPRFTESLGRWSLWLGGGRYADCKFRFVKGAVVAGEWLSRTRLAEGAKEPVLKSRARDVMTVADVMTTRVRTASPEQTVGEIWQILVDEGCHHIPIIDEGRLVGMISTTDLVALVKEHGSRRIPKKFLDEKKAVDVMTTDIESIRTDESVDVAIDRIGPGAFHALLVVDEIDGLAGIVTHHDLLYYLAS